MSTPSSFTTGFGRLFLASLAICLSAITLSGCLNDDNLIGENCYDEILNNQEELVDCGGPICEPCDPCENGEWDPLLGEQCVDCGGSAICEHKRRRVRCKVTQKFAGFTRAHACMHACMHMLPF